MSTKKKESRMEALKESESQIQEALDELLRVVEEPVRPSRGFRSGKDKESRPDKNGQDGWGVFGYLASLLLLGASLLCCVERAVEEGVTLDDSRAFLAAQGFACDDF